MKRPTRVTRGSLLGDHLLRRRIGDVVVHRAELEDLDHLVVEAVALLPEEDRTGAVEPDGDHRGEQHRRQQDERQRREDDVERPLDDDVPVGDRLVEDVEERHRADEGVGARPEAQLVGVRRQADVDRQHPELLRAAARRRFSAVIGSDTISRSISRDAAEFDQLGDRCRASGSRRPRRASGRPRGRRRCRRCGCRCRAPPRAPDQLGGRCAAADDDGAALEAALAPSSRGQARRAERERQRRRRGPEHTRRRRTGARSRAPILARKAATANSAKTSVQASDDAAEAAEPAAERAQRVAAGEAGCRGDCRPARRSTRISTGYAGSTPSTGTT